MWLHKLVLKAEPKLPSACLGTRRAPRLGAKTLGAIALSLGCGDSSDAARLPTTQRTSREPAAVNPPEASEDTTSEDNAVSERRLESVLAFTRTLGFRHASIEPGLATLRELGKQNDFRVSHTEAVEDFNDENLAQHDVIVFLSTTGDALDEAGQTALQRYIRAGGGWVGIHSASDTEYEWPWFGGLLGGDAWFLQHPPGTAVATLLVDPSTASHPSTAHLASSFELRDEWYNFRKHPGAAVNVLLRVDEMSYRPGPGSMGEDHPIAWYHAYDGGRSWYTAIGHRAELYENPDYQRHILGGLRWASGEAGAQRL